MKTFSYNRLKNARIKSISLGFVGIILNALLIFFFYLRLMNNQKDNIFQIVILSFVIMGLVILIGYMPFGQVVEKIDNKTLITYFELGPFKWGVRKYESPGKMTIVQDEKKYYCLIIGHSQDQKLILERYPTLDRAEERMIEFGKIFEPE